MNQLLYYLEPNWFRNRLQSESMDLLEIGTNQPKSVILLLSENRLKNTNGLIYSLTFHRIQSMIFGLHLFK